MRGAALGALFVLGASPCGCGGDAHDQSGPSGIGACGISGCGGDMTGTWDVTALCVRLTPQVMTGIPACDTATKEAFDSAKVVPVGAQIAFADGSYTVSGTARAEFRYTYTNGCLTAQSGLTASAETCGEVQTNLTNAGQPAACKFSGETCVCDMPQDFPMAQTGTYAVKGASLSMGAEKGPFCVHGDTAEIRATGGFSGSFSLERH